MSGDTYARLSGLAAGYSFSSDVVSFGRISRQPSTGGNNGIPKSGSWNITDLQWDLGHTHNIYLRGGVSASISSTDIETRPKNYTVRIWKRTA